MNDTRLKYREDKTTQAASILLQLANGSLNVMKLLKLLYFADRYALLTWGRPITFDWYVSMSHGPVLSFTLDKINATKQQDNSSYWHNYISERQDHEVHLINDALNDQLSPAEENALRSVWKEYGHMDQYEIRDLSHKLPEWQNPEGSSLPISIERILLCAGFSDQDVSEVLEVLRTEEFMDRCLIE